MEAVYENPEILEEFPGVKAEINDEQNPLTQGGTFFTNVVSDIFYSPMNLCLFGIILFLIYKIVRDRTEVPGAGGQASNQKQLPKLKRDFTIKELSKYDGTQEDGRILLAVNGNVYDVTKGSHFYGPGAAYATFGGRDASRNFATFSTVPIDTDKSADLSGLSPYELDQLVEWEMQIKDKYDYVGKLLRDEDEVEYEVEDVEPVARNELTSENRTHCNTSELDDPTTASGLRKRDVRVGDSLGDLASGSKDVLIKTDERAVEDVESVDRNEPVSSEPTSKDRTHCNPSKLDEPITASFVRKHERVGDKLGDLASGSKDVLITAATTPIIAPTSTFTDKPTKTTPEAQTQTTSNFKVENDDVAINAIKETVVTTES